MPITDAKTANIEWDEQGLPFSAGFDDIYFSKRDGIAESRYVFLEANNLSKRWETLTNDDIFTIGETGFGTGLNFLLAWQLWANRKNKNTAHLHFISVEKYPLKRSDLTQALALWPELAPYCEALIASYPPQPMSDIHRIQFPNDKVTLTLCFGEASECFEQIAPISKTGPNIAQQDYGIGRCSPHMDAWFLDGFAPSKNPEMWNEKLFSAIKQLSHQRSSFATFTAASFVRKQLSDIGFSCRKIKGFGRKREMLVGEFSGLGCKPTQSSTEQTAPPTHFREYKHQKVDADSAWHLNDRSTLPPVEHCIVVGGGLAGCHTAFALAQKNIKVTLLEKESKLAQHASGNKQGVVYAKLSPYDSPLNTFNLNALLYATQFYNTQKLYESTGDQCGVLHLATSEATKTQYKAFCEHFRESPQFAQWLDTENCERISGVKSHYPALYLPQTGWLSPADVCAHLIKHPNIHVFTGAELTELKHNDHQWQVSLSSSAPIDSDGLSCDAVVLANAYAASSLSHTATLPLKRIRGQVTHIPSNPRSQQLRTVLCGDGYIAPATDNHHCVGASFNLHSFSPEISPEDHLDNLKKLAQLSPELTPNDVLADLMPLSGKVGFRCTTPDYFPIVGPAPDIAQMTSTFAFLSKKANAVIDNLGAYHPHLYVNLGHGSRGLCYTPLAAETLACQIAGHPLPISRSLLKHLHPGRFLVRDLMRNKITLTK
ncbi:MAG: bifunctional tRNA (5-methylaminomethyl-2-thiouridine)(34)-methyltransferase MnmD/FAD-dependent 5-carboxymethylaminomethyl-2-thiouridine(34) oxidoreductase MnmC [Agarilytica sp.]